MYFKAGKHTSNNIEPEDVYTLNLNDRFYSGYANADVSNVKGSERLPRRKTEGSCPTLIGAG